MASPSNEIRYFVIRSLSSSGTVKPRYRPANDSDVRPVSGPCTGVWSRKKSLTEAQHLLEWYSMGNEPSHDHPKVPHHASSGHDPDRQKICRQIVAKVSTPVTRSAAAVRLSDFARSGPNRCTRQPDRRPKRGWVNTSSWEFYDIKGANHIGYTGTPRGR